MKKTSLQAIELENIFALVPASIYWLDNHNTYMGCNILYAKTVGLASPDEIVGKKNSDLPWNKKHLNLVKQIDKNNVDVINMGNRKVVEETCFLMDGIETVFLSHKIPLHDENNAIIGLLGVSLDINDRKKQEENLKDTTEQLKLTLNHIIAHMPAHVYWKNREGVYLGCNNLQAKSLGLHQGSDVVGKTDFELPWKTSDAENFRKNDFQVMKTGKSKTIEETALVDGKAAIVLSQKVPLHNSSEEIVGILGISTDITELKNTQKALAEQIKKTEKAYESKAEFLSVASHEIRGSVGNIIACVNLLNRGLEGLKKDFYNNIVELIRKEKNQEKLLAAIHNQFHEIFLHADEVNNQAQHALNSLIHLGDLYQLQREGVKVDFESTNIERLLQSAIHTCTEANRKSVNINVHINPAILPEITIDYKNIYEVFCVIIGNAIRFNPQQGNIDINVDKTTHDEMEWLRIAVQDQGPGIAEGHIEYIFDTFSNDGENIGKLRYRKPSLQLPQAKMKTEASGGSLLIESILDQGTAVFVELPYLVQVLEDESESTTSSKKLALAKQSILLVEDDLATQRIEKKYLEDLGNHVDTTHLGSKAIQLATKNRYDLIFLDITLPDMNGIEVAKKIREKIDYHPLFIAVTSHASDNDIDYFLSQNMTTVLTKPVSPEQFKQCIETTIAVRAELNQPD